MIDGGLPLPRPTDSEAALAATLDWVRLRNSMDKSEDIALRPLDASGTPGTLAEHLAAVGLGEWCDAILAAAGSGQPLNLEPRLGWLMSHTAVELAVCSNDTPLFRAVEKFQILGEISDTGLASAVCSRIGNGLEDHPILSCLRTRLETLWNSRFNERLRLYAEATSAQPLTTRDIWPELRGMPLGDGWAHRVAATLWPDRYMEMLASFPVPFQHGFGDPMTPIDLELVVSLVRVSPDVFSSDGTPLGPVVIFTLLDAVETLFASIDVQETANAELGLGRILDSIFSRSDGNWIGRAWLQRIIWRDTPRRAGRAQAEINAQRTLRDTLLVQLSGRIMPLAEAAFTWVCQEEPLWRADRVLSEASILEVHGDATAAAEILSGGVGQGLVSATGRPAGLITSSPEAIIVGRVLSQLPDIKQWFETLWRNTYELREHLSYWTHSALDNPAYPALAWGLIGLNSSRETPVDKAAFWRVIGSAVFETQRIDPNASLFNGAMLSITRFTVQLGAALVEHGDLPIGDFADFMADQIEPTIEHARLWQIARSAASETVILAVGRQVGAALLRQELEAALAQAFPAWDATLDRSVRDELADFANRL